MTIDEVRKDADSAVRNLGIDHCGDVRTVGSGRRAVMGVLPLLDHHDTIISTVDIADPQVVREAMREF